MNKICLLLCCLLPGLFRAGAQELKMTECAPLTQIYGEVSESDELLPMGDVGVEFGYVLYQAAITVPAGEAALELENVRDYAAVYLDGVFQGTLTDNRKTLVLKAETGQHTLQLYVENIGRITYGPEILDNSKGLFGEARLAGETIAGWTITPLEVRDADPETLEFEALGPCNTPCFRRGQFDRAAHEGAVYLDVSGWGMGEVWINGHYLGSFWDEEKQQSILIPAEILAEKGNRIVVFDLKNNDPGATMRLSDKPVFKQQAQPMKKITVIALLLAAALGAQARNGSGKPAYKDAGRPVEERVSDLLSRMTLEEKVMQLNQYTLGRNDNANNVADPVDKIPAEIGSLIYFDTSPELRNRLQKKAIEQSRLGIPVLFGYDVIHGFRTTYPISLAQACSWNPALVKQAAEVAAQEARMSGVEWTFSPMIDVARDGRWGRVSEGYGEDPYANAVYGVAAVEGYQGDNLADSRRVAACLKHFVGYGASEAGRDYVYTEISRQTLWDTYIPPYQAGIEAGAATVMSCFNDISGTPGTANPYILTEVLKERWAHDGFVVSDWAAIEQLRSQGVAADRKEAAEKAFNAGVEMDMMNRCYDAHLAALVREGKVSQEKLDEAVRRVLRLKFRLGLFERPYTPESEETDRFLLPASLAVAERLAEESMVLLKNENNTLPLKAARRIAVIGPMAQNRLHLLGAWSAHGREEDAVSLFAGLENEYRGRAELLYARGCDFDGKDRSGFREAVAAAAAADVVVLCLGEKKQWSGENASRSTIALPEIQEQLAAELAQTGKPLVLVLSSGRPLELCRLEPLCGAMVQMWQPGIRGGNPLAGILSGRINPSGRLAMTFPRSTGQIPIYYNRRQSGRTHQGKYQDIPSTPLYEFGHGLSYTTFEYGDLRPSATTLRRGEKVTVEVSVTNTGGMDGAETVHWFISDPVCRISRPVRELKHFEKQPIRRGETRTFRFEIDPEKDLSFTDGDGNRFLEPGDYFILVKDKKVKLTLTD